MTKKQKRSLFSIIICVVLLISAIALSKYRYISFALYILAYLSVGIMPLKKAVNGILRGDMFDENFLMTIATIGAFFLREYTEAVAVMLFYNIGELFENIAVGKSRRSIAELMNIRPDVATVIRNGEELEVSPEEIEIGEVILIRAGEKVAIDATVIEGQSSLDTSALTGESAPRDVAAGDGIQSGCVNLSGVIKARTVCTFGGSTASKILELVENASTKKERSETYITSFAKIYTPIVFLMAVLIAAVPSILLGSPAKWIERALIFLVISCPCALVISVPLTFFGGIGAASRKGILIKGSCWMEQLAKAKTVVFDKTGTLTKGSFSVSEIHSEGISDGELLYLAAHAESYSTHPIAQSIIKAYGKKIDPGAVSDVEELSGMGVMAYVDGRQVAAGNARLMEKFGAEATEYDFIGTAVHVAVDGFYRGYIIISDEIKADSADAIASLKSLGVQRTVMLTGDDERFGKAVAESLLIYEYHAGLLPSQKVSEVERLIAENAGGALAFVGDGINDAPVLTRSDIGIAMGGLGSDAAIEAADVVIMDDKPSKAALAIRISRRTISIARQNIVFALFVKVFIMLLGALGYAGMWLAVFADVGVSVIAICNAMRAMRIK